MAIRRKQYLIKKKFQFGWIYRGTILVILFALFVGYQMYISLWPPLSDFVPESRMDIVINLILVRLLIFSIPVLFSIIIFLVIFSHRVAGPIYRFEVTIDKLVAGEDVPYIRLRKHDELKEFADKLNEVIHYTRKIKNPEEEVECPPKNI